MCVYVYMHVMYIKTDLLKKDKISFLLSRTDVKKSPSLSYQKLCSSFCMCYKHTLFFYLTQHTFVQNGSMKKPLNASGARSGFQQPSKLCTFTVHIYTCRYWWSRVLQFIYTIFMAFISLLFPIASSADYTQHGVPSHLNMPSTCTCM